MGSFPLQPKGQSNDHRGNLQLVCALNLSFTLLLGEHTVNATGGFAFLSDSCHSSCFSQMMLPHTSQKLLTVWHKYLQSNLPYPTEFISVFLHSSPVSFQSALFAVMDRHNSTLKAVNSGVQ